MWWAVVGMGIGFGAAGLVWLVCRIDLHNTRRAQRLREQFPWHDDVTLTPSEAAAVNVLERMCGDKAATKAAAERERAEQEARETAEDGWFW